MCLIWNVSLISGENFSYDETNPADRAVLDEANRPECEKHCE